MVHHIVMWKLKEQAQGNLRSENVELFRSKLEALAHAIPEIKKMEVGIPTVKSTSSNFDIVLDSWFETYEDLARYQNHHHHRELVSWLNIVRDSKASVDYEV